MNAISVGIPLIPSEVAVENGATREWESVPERATANGDATIVNGAGPAATPLDKQQERILRMQQQAREYAEVERQRHERRLAQEERKRIRNEERAAAHKAELESSARKMFWIGCLACPLVFLMLISYYWKEFRDQNANPVIRTWCKRALAVWVVYMVVWITWYTVFLVYRNDELSGLNIVLYKNEFTPIKF
ncbi:hypothetical protein FVE85_4892 [Porphyridium purpureum]|uniref:Gamma-secretase subunit PEN-2 n=1 Tax=Porphyridium purpureum TaxID=35688 RepID=A0A5J4YR65_PORPP|nr:hypothetical protein FVE85_4892 [Porphyridium purpureum]|eukprot:POR1896..scf236_6